MGRRVQDTIPHHPEWVDTEVRPSQGGRHREKRNNQASKRRRAKVQNFRVGDQVLIKDRYPGSKFRTPFEKEPWMITHVKGTMIAAQRQHETITRNVSWFKQFHPTRVGRPVSISPSEMEETETYGDPGDPGLESPQSSTATNTAIPSDRADSCTDNSRLVDSVPTDPQGSETAQGEHSRAGMGRYNLRANPRQ